MPVQPRYVDVPKELVGDVELILGEIRMALRADGVPVDDDDLSFDAPEGDVRGAFGGIGPQEAAMIFVGLSVLAYLVAIVTGRLDWLPQPFLLMFIANGANGASGRKLQT